MDSQNNTKELPTIKELVSNPAEETIDKLAEAFFRTTGHGKLVEWEKFKKNFVVQSAFFTTGVWAMLSKLCELSGQVIDKSNLRKDIIKKEMENIKSELDSGEEQVT